MSLLSVSYSQANEWEGVLEILGVKHVSSEQKRIRQC